jgi:hypothetical protein
MWKNKKSNSESRGSELGGVGLKPRGGALGNLFKKGNKKE